MGRVSLGKEMAGGVGVGRGSWQILVQTYRGCADLVERSGTKVASWRSPPGTLLPQPCGATVIAGATPSARPGLGSQGRSERVNGGG